MLPHVGHVLDCHRSPGIALPGLAEQTGGADPLSEYGTNSQYQLPIHVLEPLMHVEMLPDGSAWGVVNDLADHWAFLNPTTFEVAVILFALGGIVNVLFYVPNVTISQELTPPDLRARVFGARIALLNITWLPIIVLSGALADAAGVAFLIAMAGVVTFAAALVGTLIPSVRDVP